MIFIQNPSQARLGWLNFYPNLRRWLFAKKISIFIQIGIRDLAKKSQFLSKFRLGILVNNPGSSLYTCKTASIPTSSLVPLINASSFYTICDLHVYITNNNTVLHQLLALSQAPKTSQTAYYF